MSLHAWLSATTWALSLSLACAPSWALSCPSGLSVAFNDGDFRPMINGSGARFATDPGWLVLAVRQTLKELGCEADLLRLPSRRIEAELEQGELELGLLFGHTPERAHRLAFPLDAQGQPDASLAVVSSRLVLYTLPERAEALGWDGQRVAAGRRVGVVQGNTQDLVARRLGLPTQAFSSPESGLLMLRAGRFDALLISPEALPPQERGPKPAGGPLQELTPPVQQVLYYAAAAPRLRERRPEFLPRFWSGLCQVLRKQDPPGLPPGCGKPQGTGRHGRPH